MKRGWSSAVARNDRTINPRSARVAPGNLRFTGTSTPQSGQYRYNGSPFTPPSSRLNAFASCALPTISKTRMKCKPAASPAEAIPSVFFTRPGQIE